MSKSKKTWLGILSFLPIIFGIVILIYMFTGFLPTMLRMEHEGAQENPLIVLSTIAPLLIIVIIAVILHLALLIYFIIHVINNTRVKHEERIIWILVFLFASSIGFPIYWGIRIWPDEKPDSNFVKM
jgi:hypothetical protein